ncbi:MAG: DUF2652 domain-containing protein [Vicingaceae bacterium]|nr:DUF2652 domain-containing protein [Vicingaceae bacterium]
MQIDDTLKKSLLLIPDISGFTRFVNDTEIIHGTHIVAELLEIIIKSNILDLKVAEIEGDAVLFYRIGKKPTIKEIYAQCEKMFLAFHQHLKLYERDRICDCGSCTHTPELTLKFVVHYGNIVERQIVGHLQLMGPEVTTVHKLMKNDLEMHEYMLITDNLLGKTNAIDALNWTTFSKGHSFYDDLGEVNYFYTYFKDLLANVPEPQPRKEVKLDNPTVHIETKIKTSAAKAHELLKDLNRKKEWIVGLKKVKFDQTKVPRIGTQHECLLPFNSLNIVTSENKTTSDNKIIYAERVINGGFLPTSSHVFTIEPFNDNEIKLSMDIFFKNTFLNRMFKEVMRKSFTKSIANFRAILEDKINDDL